MESFEKIRGSTIKISGYSKTSLEEVKKIYAESGATGPEGSQTNQMRKLSLIL